MGADPGGKILAWGGFGKHVVRKSQDSDEDLGVQGHVSGSWIPDRHGAPGVVEEEPVPRGIDIPEGRLQASGVSGVMDAEAGVGISSLPGRLPVFFPEEQEGDPFVALELPVDLLPVRFDPGRGRRSFLLLQNLGQKRLSSRLGQGPGKRLEELEILGDGCGGK